MTVLHRFGALAGLAVRRVVGRLRTSPMRVSLSTLGVALAVGLMVSVCGLSLGLASESVVASADTDYWVVPEESNLQSLAVSSGGVKLGDVHDVSARIGEKDGVDYAVPVLLELVPVTDAVTGEQTYVLVVGVVSRPAVELLGLPLGPLTPGDPYYANGSYDGTWTVKRSSTRLPRRRSTRRRERPSTPPGCRIEQYLWSTSRPEPPPRTEQFRSLSST